MPFLASLAAECGGRYSEYEIAQMEITVLTQLAWAIHCNTAYDFVGALGLSTLIRAGDVIGGVSIGRLDGWTQYCAEVDQLIRRYADFFVDLSVYEYPHGSQPDSLLAAAAVAAARTLFGVTPTWPECMRRDGGYALPELRATLCHLLRCAQLAAAAARSAGGPLGARAYRRRARAHRPPRACALLPRCAQNLHDRLQRGLGAPAGDGQRHRAGRARALRRAQGARGGAAERRPVAHLDRRPLRGGALARGLTAPAPRQNGGSAQAAVYLSASAVATFAAEGRPRGPCPLR